MDELTSQNPSSIRTMFGSIAGRYDLLNSVLSLGIHRVWKKKLVRMSQVRHGDSVLDCATGTGDLAFLFQAALGDSGQVVGTDFCEPMLEKARTKKRGGVNLRFEVADVLDLPYPDQTFDIASISFGIRNVKDPQGALAELARVVKPDGQVLVLEFGQPRSRLLAPLYRFYSTHILPRIGGWISGQPKAYHYLESSSAAFPCGEDFLKLARATNHYSECEATALQSGIAYLYRLKRRT